MGRSRGHAVGFSCERRDTRDGALTRYLWDQRQRLARVALPDGRALTFGYDAAARRVRKTLVRVGADGVDQPERTTHYVWDGVTIRQAITFDQEGHRSVRTYLDDGDDSVTPIGHYDDDGKPIYYVRHASGMPDELVDGARGPDHRAGHSDRANRKHCSLIPLCAGSRCTTSA